MPTVTLARATFLTAGLVAAGCEEPECTTSADCSLGLVCAENVCTLAASDDDDGSGGGSEGEGEGEGEGLQPVQLVGSLTTFVDDDLGALGTSAQQPAGTVLVGLYETNGLRDEILFFNPATGLLPSSNGAGDGVNFVGNPLVSGGTCRFDHASVQTGYGIDGLDELWLGCSSPRRVLQVRTESLENQIVEAAGEGADLMIALGPDPIDSAVSGRRVYAARGSDVLYVERRQQSDSTPSTRALDTVRTSFGAIAGLTLVATDNVAAGHGDIVAVFDRDSPLTNSPALILMERQSRATGVTTEWRTYKDAGGREHVLALPAATHAVRLGTIPNPRTLELDDIQTDTVNLEVYEPTLGKVEFGRYETAIQRNAPFTATTGGDFNPILLTAAAGRPPTTPPASDRILLLPTSDNAVFYVMTNKQVGWKIPLHQNRNDSRDNEVRFTTFVGANTAGRPVGIIAVPNSTTTAWIGLQVAGQVGQDQLLPAVFDQ